MILLAIDTCDSRGSVALLKDSEVVAVQSHESAEDYSSWLIPACEAVLRAGGLDLGEMDAYAAACGPGSFTGVRVGLTTVKAWSEVYGKPIVPVSRLEAIASQVSSSSSFVASFFDARRGQCFGALYQRTAKGLELVGDEAVIAPSDYIAMVSREAADASVVWASLDIDVLCNDPAWRSRPGPGDAMEKVFPPLAPAIGRLGVAKFHAGERTDALRLDANYVRRSDAELYWKNPLGKPTRV